MTSNDAYIRHINIPLSMPMRTTLNIDDALMDKAQRLTGITEKTVVIREALKVLIAQESARRLARLGGSDKMLADVPRRRVG
jgi:Arc/MetJ family transcription regulator